MLRSRKRIISLVLLLLVAAVGVWLFWPGKDDAAEKPFTRSAFLDHSSEWADKWARELPLEDVLRQMVVVRVPLSAAVPGYGGYILQAVSTGDTAVFDSLMAACSVTPFLTVSDPVAFAVGGGVGAYHAKAAPVRFQRAADSLFAGHFKSWYMNMDMRPSEAALHPAVAFAPGDSLRKVAEIGALPVEMKGDSAVLGQLAMDSLRSLSAAGRFLLRFRPANYRSEYPSTTVQLGRFLQDKQVFDGLLMADCSGEATEAILSQALENGAGLLLVDGDPDKVVQQLKALVMKGVISEEELRTRLHKQLLARSWLGLEPPVTRQRNTPSVDAGFLKWLRLNLLERSVALVRNDGVKLPYPLRERTRVQVVDLTGDCPQTVYQAAGFYENTVRARISDPVADLRLIWYNGDSVLVPEVKDKLHAAFADGKTVLIHSGPVADAELLTDSRTLIHLVSATPEEAAAAVHIVFGGLSAEGMLAVDADGLGNAGTGIRTRQNRLGYAVPEAVGMISDSLQWVSRIAQEGVDGRAYPGCQVLAVKDGRIIYHRQFGTLDYEHGQRVNGETVYDLASVTKIAASTMMAMKLYDMGKLGLDDRLEAYLPDTLSKHLFNRPSTLSGITWREVLTHRSGLPAGINVYPYMRYTNRTYGRYDRYYCDVNDDSLYCVEVADDFFFEAPLLDSVWRGINMIPPNPAREYVYSDLNAQLIYILLKRVLQKMEPERPRRRDDPITAAERWDGTLWEKKLHEFFYGPLRMKRTMYLPLRTVKAEEIAPTENDRFWRKQVLRGHVHDPTAAVFGGISGNAGLFSTAFDLAVMYQMMLFDGEYGGTRFLKPETIEEFTRKQANGHRGLGFNKPAGLGMYGIPATCSMRTYGHTGYTGNSVWVDPENNITYILLSNRSHPVGDNPRIITMGIQGRLHEAIYNALAPWMRKTGSGV